jgi:hypothetical protein
MGAHSQALEKGPGQVVVEHGPAEDARVRWKLDVNMMPLFFVLCIYMPSALPPA